MTFFKRQDTGRVYVIKMVLPDNCVVHKIGVTSGKTANSRMMKILESWFSYFRFVPYSELRMDMECLNPYKVEKYIHSILEKKRFTPNFKVSGHTEMFVDLNEQRVIHFLKAYNNSPSAHPPELTKDECKIICQLISP